MNNLTEQIILHLKDAKIQSYHDFFKDKQNFTSP